MPPASWAAHSPKDSRGSREVRGVRAGLERCPCEVGRESPSPSHAAWLSGALRSTGVDCGRWEGRNPPGRYPSGCPSGFSADFPVFEVLFRVLYRVQ